MTVGNTDNLANGRGAAQPLLSYDRPASSDAVVGKKLVHDCTSAERSAAEKIVYVIDDDRTVRTAVTFLLGTSGYRGWPFAVAADFLDALPALRPGCILTDVRMPDIDGLQLMQNLKQRACPWPAIVMTGHGEVAVAVKAMKLGAIEFIEKPFSDDDLLDALKRGFGAMEAANDARERKHAAQRSMAILSSREQEVLRELCGGRQNKAVAQLLSLSVRTVEMHRGNLLKKLCVRTLQEAHLLMSVAGDAVSSTP